MPDFCDQCCYALDAICLTCETPYCSDCDGRCPNEDEHNAGEDDYPDMERDDCNDNLAACSRPACECLEMTMQIDDEARKEEARAVLKDAFRFAVGEIVGNNGEPRRRFKVSRRWLDVDDSAENNRYYDIAEECSVLSIPPLKTVPEGFLQSLA